jgi:hypothetical protein
MLDEITRGSRQLALGFTRAHSKHIEPGALTSSNRKKIQREWPAHFRPGTAASRGRNTSTAKVRTIADNLTTASQNLVEIGIGVKEQFLRVEAMIADTGNAIESQIQRFDRASRDIVNRIGETASIVQDSFVRPVREVSAFAKGIGRGFEALLFRKPRRPVDQARQDEELFI